MENIQLKVCGLTQLDQIQVLIDEKVDYLGFIFFSKSPRFVLNSLSLKEIKNLDHQSKVGVFVNEDVFKIVNIAEEAQLNYIQLHGDESIEYIKRLRSNISDEVKIIKVFRIGTSLDFISNFNKTQNQLKNWVDYYLFDTDSQAYGGTGKTFDWSILNEIKVIKPYFLSGGISPNHINGFENLKQIPYALDINSRFEINTGIKDINLIKKYKKQIQKTVS